MKVIKSGDTYQKLENMLYKTGFHIAGKKGSNNIYAHKSIDSIIVLPSKTKMEAVKGTYVTAIKRALVDNGLIGMEEFEKEFNTPTARRALRLHAFRAHRQRAAKDKLGMVK